MERKRVHTDGEGAKQKSSFEVVFMQKLEQPF